MLVMEYGTSKYLEKKWFHFHSWNLPYLVLQRYFLFFNPPSMNTIYAPRISMHSIMHPDYLPVLFLQLNFACHVPVYQTKW